MKSREFLLAFILIFLLSYSAQKSFACDEYFLPPAFTSWEYTKDLPEIKVSDLLPQTFIEKVEAAQGPISIKMEYRYGSDLHVNLSTENYGNFISWAFMKNAKDPNSMIIERLRLENPLVEKGDGLTHHGQLNKGLPSDVFRFARSQLFEIIKASGKTVVTSKTSQNYTVYILYQKLVGMTPKTAEGLEFSQLLDRYYDFGRKKLPEEYRFKSLNDYAYVLGDYYGSSVSKPAKELWASYVTSGNLPSELELLTEESGAVIGFIYKDAPLNYTKVHFIYPNLPNKPIIEFKDAMRVPGLTELEKVLQ